MVLPLWICDEENVSKTYESWGNIMMCQSTYLLWKYKSLKQRKAKGKKRSSAPTEKSDSTSVINIYYLWHLSYIENAEQIQTDLYNTPTIRDTHTHRNYSR